MHAAHAAHMILHEKQKHEKKFEQDKKKLGQLKIKLRSNFASFVKGRQQTQVGILSREFLKQAIVVENDKRKLDSLRGKLQQAILR